MKNEKFSTNGRNKLQSQKQKQKQKQKPPADPPGTDADISARAVVISALLVGLYLFLVWLSQ